MWEYTTNGWVKNGGSNGVLAAKVAAKHAGKPHKSKPEYKHKRKQAVKQKAPRVERPYSEHLLFTGKDVPDGLMPEEVLPWYCQRAQGLWQMLRWEEDQERRVEWQCRYTAACQMINQLSNEQYNEQR